MAWPRCACGGFLHHNVLTDKRVPVYVCSRCRVGAMGHDERFYILTPDPVEVRLIKNKESRTYSAERLIPETKVAA